MEKRILEEVVFYIKLWDVVNISCAMIRVVFRNNIEKIVRRLLFNNFEKKLESCGTNVFAEVIQNLTL